VLRSIEKPIRVRFEHTRYPHWGGHSGYVLFANQLDPGRFRVRVHTSSDSNTDLPPWLKPAKPWLKRVVGHSGMSWYKLSDLHAEIVAMAAGTAGRFDIVHFLDGEHSGRFSPRFLRYRSRVKSVATFHQPPELIKDLLHIDALRWLDQIVLVSPSQLPFFRQHVEEERLSVILHGVDTHFFRPTEHPNAGDRVRCITVGHWLRDWQIFDTVARAMPDIQFDVVAGRKQVAATSPNVHIHRSVDDFELADLYRRADILFLPLLQSTANNALLEGLASGLAVVSTDLEAVRAYVPNAEALLLESRADNFVQAIRALQQNPSLRQEMSRKARLRAEELAWPRLARCYEVLYSRLATGATQ
jgi:glycosyltransferase involved in cell wall biosynthesis